MKMKNTKTSAWLGGLINIQKYFQVLCKEHCVNPSTFNLEYSRRYSL